jgi:hypothetical protein
MSILLLALILIFVFGGFGWNLGGPWGGGYGIGSVLLVILLLYLIGALR